MKEKDDFYIGYVDQVSPGTKKLLKRFVMFALVVLLGMAAIFGLTQNKLSNSAFDFGIDTAVTGTYHEQPYPMLRVQTEENTFKNIVLLGFGKLGPNSYLNKIRSEVDQLSGSTLRIEGELVYYNGKTLLQLTSDEKVSLVERANGRELPKANLVVSDMELSGEIIDPKCYFGVMKPGKGKIHRSCAVLCIAGGIPPVLATTDENNISEYYMITDSQGKAINQDILPYVGKPSLVKGTVVKLEDWYQLRINTEDIKDLDSPSKVY